MLGDTPVLYFDFGEFVVQELQPGLVPFAMRGGFDDSGTKEALIENIQLLRGWLQTRLLERDRDNICQLCMAAGFPRLNTPDVQLKACLWNKGVSVTDSYWVKPDEGGISFQDVNVRLNKFKPLVDVSLYGMTPQDVLSEGVYPDLATHGTFRKAWVWDEDGLCLLKSDRHENNISGGFGI